jgi:hypothetical protein
MATFWVALKKSKFSHFDLISSYKTFFVVGIFGFQNGIEVDVLDF